LALAIDVSMADGDVLEQTEPLRKRLAKRCFLSSNRVSAVADSEPLARIIHESRSAEPP
jgi:hypothetical protein